MKDFFPFKGKSTSPAKSHQLFNNRKYYKLATTLIYDKINNNYIDLWYDVPYYGKVDRKGFLVAPKTYELNYALNDNLVVFDFVGQAFEEAMFFLRRASAAGRTELGRLLNDFTPKRSFMDSEDIYLRYGASIVDAFNYEALLKGKVILNFETYVCSCLKYILSTPQSFFSYYSIFASFLTPINATALSIDFDIEDQDDDKLKNQFYSHNELDKYINTMANFGFRINKNAPWQIIADLNSKPMLEGRSIKSTNPLTGEDTIEKTDGYLQQHFIPTIDHVFKKYYSRVMFRTLTLLQNVLVYGYSAYQKSTKYVVLHGKPEFSVNSSLGLVTYGEVFRPPSKQAFVKNYSQKKGMNKMHVIHNDLRNFGFTERYYLPILEEILKHEYAVKNTHQYAAFKKRFDRSVRNDYYMKTLELLENFYSPTKIYDPKTKKLLWTIPKKNLTKQQKQNMIPDESNKPTVERTVSEFFIGN